MRAGAHRMGNGHHRICCGEVMLPGAGAWWILVFILIRFPSMGEKQIMCDMYMDEARIPMLMTMSKE